MKPLKDNELRGLKLDSDETNDDGEALMWGMQWNLRPKKEHTQ